MRITPKFLYGSGALLFFIASLGSFFSYCLTYKTYNLYSTISFFSIAVIFNLIVSGFFYTMFKDTPDEIKSNKDMEDLLKELQEGNSTLPQTPEMYNFKSLKELNIKKEVMNGVSR